MLHIDHEYDTEIDHQDQAPPIPNPGGWVDKGIQAERHNDNLNDPYPN